eukprot:3649479-Rhodomonas_salina.1
MSVAVIAYASSGDRIGPYQIVAAKGETRHSQRCAPYAISVPDIAYRVRRHHLSTGHRVAGA